VVWFSFVLQLCFLCLNSSMGRYWSIKEWRKRNKRDIEWSVLKSEFALAPLEFGRPLARAHEHTQIRCNGFMWCQITSVYSSRSGWSVDPFLSAVDLTLVSAFDRPPTIWCLELLLNLPATNWMTGFTQYTWAHCLPRNKA